MGDKPAAARHAPSTMGELLDLLAAGRRVLDLGCGRGSFRYDDYAHLEIAALDEFPAASAPPFPAHARYRQGTAERLPYPDEHFDLVITNFVLEHVQDFPRAIEEIARVVKPGGHFYMAVPDARSFEDTLYRALYAGGGHVQRHSFESVLATVYGRTALKLIAYNEWPAGFTFLEDREGLRALVGQLAEVCRETLHVDLRARSNYLFVFQRQHGLGRRVTAAACGYCGSGVPGEIAAAEWDCPQCGRRNGARVHGEASDERLDGDMRALWARHPHLRPGAPEPAPRRPRGIVRRAGSWLRRRIGRGRG